MGSHPESCRGGTQNAASEKRGGGRARAREGGGGHERVPRALVGVPEHHHFRGQRRAPRLRAHGKTPAVAASPPPHSAGARLPLVPPPLLPPAELKQRLYSPWPRGPGRGAPRTQNTVELGRVVEKRTWRSPGPPEPPAGVATTAAKRAIAGGRRRVGRVPDAPRAAPPRRPRGARSSPVRAEVFPARTPRRGRRGGTAATSRGVGQAAGVGGRGRRPARGRESSPRAAWGSTAAAAAAAAARPSTEPSTSVAAPPALTARAAPVDPSRARPRPRSPWGGPPRRRAAAWRGASARRLRAEAPRHRPFEGRGTLQPTKKQENHRLSESQRGGSLPHSNASRPPRAGGDCLAMAGGILTGGGRTLPEGVDSSPVQSGACPLSRAAPPPSRPRACVAGKQESVAFSAIHSAWASRGGARGDGQGRRG